MPIVLIVKLALIFELILRVNSKQCVKFLMPARLTSILVVLVVVVAAAVHS